MSTERVRVVVRGIVQGVWFRESTRQAALERGLAGWVRNRSDGSVEAVFEGDPDAVESVVAWTRMGPPRASVESVDEFREEPEGLYGFDVRF